MSDDNQDRNYGRGSINERLFTLEHALKSIEKTTNRLLVLLEGEGTKDGGIREAVAELRREVGRITTLSRQIETLEESAARKEEFKQVELRVQASEARLNALEKQGTVNQGIQLGRRGVWIVVSAAIGFIAMVLGLLLSIQNLVSRVA